MYTDIIEIAVEYFTFGPSFGDMDEIADGSEDGEQSPSFRTLTDFRYDEQSGMYRAQYDPSAGSELVVDVVLALSDVLGVSANDVEPFYQAVDVDVFEALVSTYGTECGPSVGPVVFSLDDFVVTVGESELTFERRTR